MATERAAKRARSEGAASDAAGTSGAPGPSGGGRVAENAFDVLPDDLVQRIMSLVEARDAWEVSRLQQVDRRFRRLVGGVEWEEMRMVLKHLVRGKPQAHQQQVQRYLRMLKRMTGRLRRGEMQGARRVFVSLVSFDYGDVVPQALVEPTIDVADAVLALVAALAVAPLLVERICFHRERSSIGWPSDDDQRAAGLIPAPRSLESFAFGLLVALSPAKALRSMSAARNLARSLAGACKDLPADCAPAAATLHELSFTDAYLSTEPVAAIVRTWPALRSVKVELGVDGGGGLAELARLPSLEAIEAEVEATGSESALEHGLLALAGAAGAATRLHELCLRFDPNEEPFSHLTPYEVGKKGITAVLSLRSLQRLSIGANCDSAEVIGGLAALEQLRELDLYLYLGDRNEDIEDSADRAAALLAAAAAALKKARALQRLRLFIEDENGFAGSQPAAGGLVSLLCVGRPSLVQLSFYSRSERASPTFLREVALCGPRLVSVRLTYGSTYSPDVRDLPPFRELLALSADRLPSFKLRLQIIIDDLVLPSVEAILTSWFDSMSAIDLEIK